MALVAQFQVEIVRKRPYCPNYKILNGLSDSRQAVFNLINPKK